MEQQTFELCRLGVEYIVLPVLVPLVFQVVLAWVRIRQEKANAAQAVGWKVLEQVILRVEKEAEGKWSSQQKHNEAAARLREAGYGDYVPFIDSVVAKLDPYLDKLTAKAVAVAQQAAQ